jgi:hypothetical protein
MGPGSCAIAAPAINTAPIANPTRATIETLISLFPFPSLLCFSLLRFSLHLLGIAFVS